jgi:MHS family proline/betaine transporter-like MFS transporter
MSEKINRKVIVSGMLGNGLEWYDFALYGHMAFIISKLFFPEIDPTVALIATYGTFAAGFIARPFGAILFGWMGDKFGRRIALAAAILMMAIPTGMIGLLPTYAEWGIVAPICLIVIRVLQGLSMGGEFSGAITYMVEHSPPKKRALSGSAAMFSLVIGFLLGSVVTTLFSSFLSEADFESWGWRIPFLFGIIVGIIGFYIRSHCEESPAFEEAKAENALSETPVRDAFTKYPKNMFQAFTIYLFVTIPFYTVAIYFITYTKIQLNQPASDALTINVAAMASMLITMPFAALLADRIGRKKVLIAAIVILLVSIYPIFQMLNHSGGDFNQILMAQMALGMIIGIYLAPVPALLVESFPTSIRFTGMALSYNICAIVGGLTPAVSTWLISTTGNNDSIMFVLVGSAVASLLGLMVYKDRWQEPLTSMR